MKDLETIFSQLGLDKNNGLFITKEKLWKKNSFFPNRVKRIIDKKINPYAFFCFDNKPLILFFYNPSNKKELHKAIWNFNESPIVIIVENDIIEIFNGFNYLKEDEKLEKLGGNESISDFNYFELVTGNTWTKFQEQLNYKNRIDYHLLNNIKAARKLLVEKHRLNTKIANAILGKSIFVRYLIDRKVKMRFDVKDKLKKWTNTEFCELFDNPQKIKKFFDYLEDKDRGFNGDLFPLSNKEYDQISKEDYQVIQRLLLGEDIEKNQPSLFELYDFSIIPIEFISNVYELFIGQENQKKEGAYYTPLFLVDYILKETVEKKLENEKASFSCKVFDPACGSGIFLVETLRKIIEKYINLSGVDVKSPKFKTAIKKITIENIYGIDKDLSAVQVAIFSIYLTLLDYLEPPGIETFKFPVLFNTNFFEADFFNKELIFNSYFEDINFDFILGNPPWKGGGMDKMGNKYLNDRKKKENKLNKKFEVAVNNNEIAEGFVLRASDFCSETTKISFIVRSSILYNLGYNNDKSPFRQYWLEEYFVDKVFELAPVRHEVFDKSNKKAVAPAAVLFYRYAEGESTDNNIIEHISLKESRFFTLFKIFTITKNDNKKVQQKRLKEFDWLLKVLVYGSYLDFNFIKRIKLKYDSVKKIISDENKFVESTGLHSRKEPIEKPKDTSLIENTPFLKTDAIKSFYIDYNDKDLLEKDKIDIIKDIRIYKNPMLLIREGIDMESLTAKCSISKKDVLFKDSITSIKIIHKTNMEVLRNIVAIYSTSLFSYYAINLFASIGIERERVKNYNKYSLPYLELNVNEQIDNIENAYAKIYKEKQNDFEDSIKVDELYSLIQNELNKIKENIFNKLEVNEIESSLIEYATEVNRILITGNDSQKKKLFSSLDLKDDILRDYALLFIERFKPRLDTQNKKFIVEVWYTNKIIGMFFKMIPSANYSKSIIWNDKTGEDKKLLSILTKISSKKITDKLFVQKDIRGFEKDYFFIFKPNERRLWHKAIGYLDVDDFVNAILKTESEGV